uniref:Uncharacterized protein n=1 Tax=Rheinheimera sp. BAL341 TaxID=1708203 RepID=A0A486XQK9_9GAMM
MNFFQTSGSLLSILAKYKQNATLNVVGILFQEQCCYG